VILVTDTSGSMQADDVKPTRLDAARNAAKTFINETPGKVDLGFVSFNSTAQLVVPPTSDRNRVKAGLDTVRPGGGTAIGSAIETSLGALAPTLKDAQKQQQQQGKSKKPSAPPAVVVLLSDGANTAGESPHIGAQHAQQLHVPVYTVALGSKSAVVQVADPVGGFHTVQVPPDPTALKRVAEITGAKFFATADSSKLADIYKSLGSRIGFKKERRELTAAFAAGGLVLLMLGGVFSLAWFGRLP
jgi:Ca-activated chloride channel family protein